MIVAWAPITKTEWIPPFGNRFKQHFREYRGGVKYASCSAWGLLYQVLVEHNLGYGNVMFEKNGKPYFNDYPIFFSLSHSKNVCAVAVSDQPIGIDIELYRKEYHPRLVERSLSKAEKMSYNGDFTRIWCRKEAGSKIDGRGIVGYPEYIDTTDPEYGFREKMIEVKGEYYWLVVATAMKKETNEKVKINGF